MLFSPSVVSVSVTGQAAAPQASLSFTVSQGVLRLELGIPLNHLTLNILINIFKTYFLGTHWVPGTALEQSTHSPARVGTHFLKRVNIFALWVIHSPSTTARLCCCRAKATMHNTWSNGHGFQESFIHKISQKAKFGPWTIVYKPPVRMDMTLAHQGVKICVQKTYQLVS